MPAPKTAPLPGGKARGRTKRQRNPECPYGRVRSGVAHASPDETSERHAGLLRMLGSIRDRIPRADRLLVFRVAALVGVASNSALVDRDPGEVATWASQLADAMLDEPSDDRPPR